MYILGAHEPMNKIVILKKKGIDLPIKLDVSRIVAITDISTKEPDTYYIYFEYAVWAVQADSYESVYKTWSEYVQH
jgi:hypothetical protein